MCPDTPTKQLPELKTGAILIGDAHYAPYRPELLEWLGQLVDDPPPQLIIMGDLFDLLIGHAPATWPHNEAAIGLIKLLGEKTEIIYLEGNHDFGMHRLFSFPCIARTEQPYMMRFCGKRVALHHGDAGIGIGYALYTALIRNPLILWCIDRADRRLGGKILTKLESFNRKKKPCYRNSRFETLVEARLAAFQTKYAFDLWIEGHFHQDKRLNIGDTEYLNLPAFACNHRYVIVQSNNSGSEPFMPRQARLQNGRTEKRYSPGRHQRTGVG